MRHKHETQRWNEQSQTLGINLRYFNIFTIISGFTIYFMLERNREADEDLKLIFVKR